MQDKEKQFFGVVDYVLFVLLLGISAGIGIYYKFSSRNLNDTKEFLLGGRSLSVFPVATSIFASSVSAIALLGTPSEIYRYGTQYMMISVGVICVIPIAAYLFLPVFYNLNVTSVFEIIYMAICLYAPALALAEVTNFSMWSSILSVGLVCTFYTGIGGVKAVVATDLLQSFIMYISLLILVIKGCYDAGGFNIVWQKNEIGERIEFFNFNSDPTTRYTFWSSVVGGGIMWLDILGVGQISVQRCLSISTLKGAQRCLWLIVPAFIFITTISALAGLEIYAYYSACDPIGSKIINSPDQLLPRFEIDTMSDFPGLPGLFILGLFSGSLSSLSSGMNSISAVFLEDIIKIYISPNISEVYATRVLRYLAMACGVVTIALAFAAEKLGGLLQASLAMSSISGGPMLGIYVLGMFIPWSNSNGALAGFLNGIVVATWACMGSFMYQPFNLEAPRSYDNCTELYFNATGVQTSGLIYITPKPNDASIFPLYRLSYLWLTSFGFIVTVVVGTFISYLTGPEKFENIDEKLLSPFVFWVRTIFIIRKQENENLRCQSQETCATIRENYRTISDEKLYLAEK